MTAAKQKLARRRVQIDFLPDAHERLLDLIKETGASSSTEVIRNALRLYEFFINHKKNNSKILIEKEDGSIVQVELVF